VTDRAPVETARLVGLDDVRRSAERIRGVVHRTPVLTSRSLDERTGAHLFFKCENLQRVGAFKIRGAANAVLSLPEAEARRGVAAHSSGNHAAALALAAATRGIPAYVVMPETTPRVKREAVAGYGARITYCRPTQASREEILSQVLSETGAHFVPPFNDVRIIAGQGTAALELCEQAPDLDVVVAPVGGGGLMSGTAVSVRALRPDARIVGVEPERADDTFRSLRSGHIESAGDPDTIADGLRTTIGVHNFAHLRALGVEVVTVSEEEIVAAMRDVWERMKLVVEPSGAVPVAALLAGRLPVTGRRVGVILSGGNVDLDQLPWNA
jgi:threonine dehydratase